jgi:hypothetical protein
MTTNLINHNNTIDNKIDNMDTSNPQIAVIQDLKEPSNLDLSNNKDLDSKSIDFANI